MSVDRANNPPRKLMTPGSVSVGGLVIDALLSGGKITVGAAFGSQAILADGLHSASDLVTDVAVIAGLRVSNKPADDDHPYGHRRVSTLVGLFVGVMLLLAAGWIVFSAIGALRRGEVARGLTLPLIVALVSVVLKELLFRVTHTVGVETGDVSLTANAWHHRTDAFSSVAAAIGIAAAMIGGAEWAWLDSATAILLSSFLIFVAVRIMYSSASELIDRAPDQCVLDALAEVVAATPDVRSFHALRARHVGGKIEMDVHVQVDPTITVDAGHDIAETVKRRVKESDRSVMTVVVHVEPASGGE